VILKMLSIVCVYNNEETLNRVFLKSIEKQTVDVELILLDNRGSQFKSAAEALNEGGRRAKGEFVVFAHQDMWFSDLSWMEKAEKLLPTLPGLGIAGVAGTSEKGKSRRERLKTSIEVFNKPFWDEIGLVSEPEEVQTLDECVLVIPSKLFETLKFDSQVFDGWDCYGADYCLSAKKLGYKAYVLPLTSTHCCKRGNHYVWEFPLLLEYQQRLYKKHGKQYKTIYTYLLDINRKSLAIQSLLKTLWPAYLKLFPIFKTTLKKELEGCHSAIDLGCGHYSMISDFDIPFLIGVDLHGPSLKESKRIGTHHISILSDVNALELKPKSVDAVVAVEVLEKLTQKEGARLLSKMEKWARKKIVIITPNGDLGYKEINKNPFQEQRSVWNTEDFRELGFKVSGIGGWIGVKSSDNIIEFSLIRDRLSHFSQRIIHLLPRLAMKLLVTKRLD
jgi:GT2 family glycosyltransferase